MYLYTTGLPSRLGEWLHEKADDTKEALRDQKEKLLHRDQPAENEEQQQKGQPQQTGATTNTQPIPQPPIPLALAQRLLLLDERSKLLEERSRLLEEKANLLNEQPQTDQYITTAQQAPAQQEPQHNVQQIQQPGFIERWSHAKAEVNAVRRHTVHIRGRRADYDSSGENINPVATIIYLHGFPLTNGEACVFHELARELKIQIIAPHRPGYGKSEYYKDAELKSGSFSILTRYVEDIADLVIHLGLKEFGVLGLSGGGPYAIACALKLQS